MSPVTTDIVDRLARIETKLDATLKDVEELKAWRYKVAAALAVAASLSGAVGAKIGSMIQ